MRIKLIFYFLTFIVLSESIAQSVTMSKDLSIRNSTFYDVLSLSDDKVLLLRNISKSLVLDVFDSSLSHLRDRELLEKHKRKNIIGVSSVDSSFNVFFTKNNNSNNVFVNKYNSYGVIIDSISFTSEFSNTENIRFHSSTSDAYSVIFSLKDKGISNFYVVNNSQLNLLWERDLKILRNVRSNLSSLEISESGLITILSKKDLGLFESEKNEYFIDIIDSSYYSFSKFSSSDNKFIESMKLFYNTNDNSIIDIFGLYGDNSYGSKGFFKLTFDSKQHKSIIEISPIPFDHSLIEMFNKKYSSRDDYIQNLYLKDVVRRKDNGFLLIMEINKQFNKVKLDRFHKDNTKSRIEYLDRDIILMNYDTNINLDWNKVLHKNQFSYNNKFIFSSFFLLKKQESMCFLFNDMIKQNSTVSQYCVSPTGNLVRKTIINTYSKDLQLRFIDAIQIKWNEILIPNQIGTSLNLVKLRIDN